MLARVDADGVVLRSAADANAPVIARLERGTVLGIRTAPSPSDEFWLEATLPDGRTGILSGAVPLHPLREVVLAQAEAEVQDRPGAIGMPVRTLRKGARFHVLRTVEEPGGDWVEIRQPSGAGGFLPAKARIANAPEDAAGAFGPETRGIERGVLGGALMMVAAVVWFVVGRNAGVTFFYPPVLFLFGLYAVARGLWTGNLRGRRHSASEGGASAPDRRVVRGLALGGIVLVAVVVALLTRKGASVPAAGVWLANGLDVPVTVTLDGTDATLAPRTVHRVGSHRGARHVIARTASGATLEDLHVDDPADGSFVLYNALGAAPVFVELVVYAEQPGELPEPEHLAGSSWTVARRVEHPFEAAPARLAIRGRRAERRRAVLLDGGWRAAVEAALAQGEARRAADLAARVALAQGDEPSIRWAGNALVGADAAAALRFGEEAAARHPSSVEAHRVLQTAMERLGRGDEALARYRAAQERDPTSARAAYLHARLLPAAQALPLLERAVADHPTDSWLRLALGWVLFGGRRYEAAIPHFERVRTEDVGAEAVPLALHARALAATGRTPEAQRLLLERIGPGTWANLVVYEKLRRLPEADRSLRPGVDLVESLETRGLPPAEARCLLASLSRDAAGFARHSPAIGDPAFREGLRIALLCATDVDAAAEAAAAAPAAARTALDAVAAVTVGCELLRRGRADLAREVYDACLASLGEDLPFTALAAPETAGADEDLDFEVRAALLVAAARRATDPAERDRLLGDARAYDLLRCVVPP